MNSPNPASGDVHPSNKAPQTSPPSDMFVFTAGGRATRGIPNSTTLKHSQPPSTTTFQPFSSGLAFQPTGVGFPDGSRFEFDKTSIPSHVQPATVVTPDGDPIDDPHSTDTRNKAPSDTASSASPSAGPTVVPEDPSSPSSNIGSATDVEEKRPEVNEPYGTTNTRNPAEPANVQVPSPPTEPVNHSDKSNAGDTPTPNEPSNAHIDPEREQEPVTSTSSKQPKAKPELVAGFRAIESRSLTPFSSDVLSSFRKGIEDALCGKPFGDVKVYANSRRSVDGKLHEPKVLVVPGSLLMAVSKEFQRGFTVFVCFHLNLN